MSDALPEITRALNIVLTVAMTIIAACVLLVLSGKASAQARADRYSIRVELPYGSERTRVSVTRALRLRTLAGGCAILAGSLVSAALLFTPLAESPFFIFSTLLPSLVVGTVIGTTLIGVRERLFHPAPDAPRIARARSMRASDYLDPVRRALPWALAAIALVPLAAVGVSALRTPGRVDAVAAPTVGVLALVAVTAFALLPRLERLILAQPQPASDTLELAWDDALRAGAIISLRLSCALAAWFVFSLSVVALWLPTDSPWNALAAQLPTWGMIALQFVYPNDGKPLPAPLHPDWLPRPASAGGPA